MTTVVEQALESVRAERFNLQNTVSKARTRIDHLALREAALLARSTTPDAAYIAVDYSDQEAGGLVFLQLEDEAHQTIQPTWDEVRLDNEMWDCVCDLEASEIAEFLTGEWRRPPYSFCLDVTKILDADV